MRGSTCPARTARCALATSTAEAALLLLTTPQMPRPQDKRVSSMLEKLREEISETETTIGEAFHSLDLDRDGVLSHAELLAAMDSLDAAKRPDAEAFKELLDQIDVDHVSGFAACTLPLPAICCLHLACLRSAAACIFAAAGTPTFLAFSAPLL